MSRLMDFFTRHLSQPPQTGHDDDTTALAAAVTLYEMARSRPDSDNGPEQAILIDELSRLLHLTRDAAGRLEQHAEAVDEESTSLYPFTHLINGNWPYPKKLALLDSLWDAAYRADMADHYGDIYIGKIAHLLNISYRDQVGVRLQVEQRHQKS